MEGVRRCSEEDAIQSTPQPCCSQVSAGGACLTNPPWQELERRYIRAAPDLTANAVVLWPATGEDDMMPSSGTGVLSQVGRSQSRVCYGGGGKHPASTLC